MKILDISFKNLNSLRGEWHIDLTSSIYTSDGIFAITGPTGAGKTTIFDAVCLALYGQTPRLGKIGGQSNEIMSRQTGECYARVIFETHGKKYICLWSQKRMGKSGQFQPANHSISEISGSILASSLMSTRSKVEEVTGMDFGRFTQAMMLEQGGFDAFISADKKDRAAVLELITGTEIYSRISRLVYDRSKKEKDKLREHELLLTDKQTQLQAASPESITAELAHERSRIAELESGHAAIKSAKEWHKELARLESDLSRTNDDISTQQKRLDDFEARRKRLDAAERAASLALDHSSLTQLRTSRKHSSDECSRLADEVSRCESEIAQITNELIPQAQDALAKARGTITDSPDVLKDRIFTAVERYEQAMKDRSSAAMTLAQNERLYTAAQAATKRALAEREGARRKMDDASNASSKALDELMQSRARTTAAVLDEERTKLRPGTPCPLCGSLEHPLASHEHEHSDSSQELFSRTDKLNQKAQQCREVYDKAFLAFQAAEGKYNAAVVAETNARNTYEHSRTDLDTKKQEADDRHREAVEAISPLKLANIKSTDDIKTRVTQWVNHIKKVEERIATLESGKRKREGIIEAQQKSLLLERENLDKLTAELEESERSFAERLHDKNFADESEFTASCMSEAELESLRKGYQELTERMAHLRDKKNETEQSLSEKRALNVTTLTREETDSEFERLESELKAANAKAAVFEQKLKDSVELKAKIDELTRAYNEQKNITDDWAALSGLIGSADGDKFRIFAQKITLDLVVNNANLYLQKMSGRYLLKSRPNSDKLELSVIDNEQAGEVRPTENLSGGERFIISLALALGLSQISGSKARVDSLFLDEGFGSLDDESLNTALEALGEVRREGRMIGIISHVAALRERIAAQIRVIPKNEGSSVIDGPGCERVK